MLNPQATQNYNRHPAWFNHQTQCLRSGAEMSIAGTLGQRNDNDLNSVDALHNLSISNRERIKLLKAFLAALKEETTSRSTTSIMVWLD